MNTTGAVAVRLGNVSRHIIIYFLVYLLSHFTTYFKTSGTKHVSSVYNVAAILGVKYKVHVIFFPTINVLRFSFSSFGRIYALPSMALCFRHLMKCFQSLLFRYYLNEFQVIPFSLSISYTWVFSCYIPLVLYTYSKASYFKKIGFFLHLISISRTVMFINSYVIYFYGLLSPVFFVKYICVIFRLLILQSSHFIHL